MHWEEIYSDFTTNLVLITDSYTNCLKKILHNKLLIYLKNIHTWEILYYMLLHVLIISYYFQKRKLRGCQATADEICLLYSLPAATGAKLVQDPVETGR